ncbi:hypothetical protein L1987_04279 [Smallanthus sonchifolius]|uniref:Uncharacterized protein n=1 Tax=Smallanthus sonchifolius TaxID=185202 RepID=A0ACB9KCZ9_9ASTR|nr:hypothetical protein L1987_04279 [Smallanthus sonchifolius]
MLRIKEQAEQLKKMLEQHKVLEISLPLCDSERETVAMVDRLSDLPESLQLRILSRLDARQAVQTLALSKSWVSSWTCIPVLNFTCDGLDAFVVNALSRRQSVKLDKLTFKHTGTCGDIISEKVFDYAFSHGVEELEAKLQYINSWPIGLHTSSDSLTSLKLFSGNSANCSFLEPRSGSFKNLTNLYLREVIITNLDPFSGFPALDKLRLDFCPLRTKGNALNVHAPRLSEFAILYYKQYVNRCEFTTPKLRYFEWQGCNFPKLTCGGLPVLETVVIDYNGHCRQEQERMMFDDLLMLFNPLQNARSLTLFSPVVHLLTQFPVNGCSPFWKLKRLKLDFISFRNDNLFKGPCRLLMDLLELVPGLEAYLLPKSDDANCSVMVINEINPEARAVLKAAFARRKAIQ